MDFSTIPRSLESLRRRNPPLPASVLEIVEKLNNDPTDLASIQDLLVNDSERWETLAVGLHVGTSLLEKKSTVYMDGPRVPNEKVADTLVVTATTSPEQIQALCPILHSVCMANLEHTEPRIRTFVAKAVGAYCAVIEDVDLVLTLHDRLKSSIHEHLVRGRDTAEHYSRTTDGAMDDTTGWRALETNWLCLAAMVGGMRERYFEITGEIDAQLLLDSKESAVDHVNRHVRAAAMQCLEQWIVSTTDHQPLRDTVVAVLKVGLADNWSQVRMAASVLCRAWLENYTSFKEDKLMMTALLPRMCLNRFYLAAGVKLYSHETWRLVFADGSGLDCLKENINAVVRYYVKMCDADNHVVREAACQAIAEIGSRVTPLEDHIVDTLLQALLMCFYDESWPVRDEACLACGSLCKVYPSACKKELKTLWERWTEQLTDQIWSVRAGAAVALGDALEAFPSELSGDIRSLIAKLLPSAKDQPAMTASEYKAHVNDAEQHSNTQLYSCGSLAPKLRKGGAGRLGCSSCGVDRPKAPWEATDGCLYLIRELVVLGTSEQATTPITDEELIPLWEQMMDVCRVQHFPQSHELRATLWKVVPPMAQALGKTRFKRHYLSSTIELLFWNLDMSSATQLEKHSAGECAELLADLIGWAMFRGRLDDWQQEILDKVVRNRKATATFEPVSPFGPPVLSNH